MTDKSIDVSSKTKTTAPDDGSIDAGKETVAEAKAGGQNSDKDWNKDVVLEAWSLPTAAASEKSATDPAALDVAQKPAENRPAESQDRPKNSADLAGNPLRFGGLEQAIKVADTTNATREINRLLEGQLHGLNMLETIYKPGEPKEGVAALEEVFGAIDVQKENHYMQYLSPATSRAELAVAKISSGDAELVAEGERGLVEAVRLRPELQFNPQFQEGVENAYKAMAAARVKAGLPALEKPAGQELPDASTSGAYDLLGKAQEKYAREGYSTETARLFAEARDVADHQDFEKLGEQRLDMFAQRLALMRSSAELEARGSDATTEKDAISSLASREWDNYKDYLAPGAVRTNEALALIASGNPDHLAGAKKVLADAVNSRPALEFSSDYQQHLRAAFNQHYVNRPSPVVTADNTTPAPQALESTPGYRPIDSRELGGKVPEIDQDTQLDGYLADKVTGPALAAGLIYLAYRQGKYQVGKVMERVRELRAGKTAEGTNEVKPAQKGDTTGGDRATRPDRESLADKNVSRTELQTGTDGTRRVMEGDTSLSGLGWRQRLTDAEIKELDTRRNQLEERVKKGDTLKAEETKELDSLRYFDKNRHNPEVHRQVIERMAEGRPEGGFNEKSLRSGGFRLRHTAAPLVGAAFLLVALMEAQTAHAQTNNEPLRRARFGP